MDVQLVARKLSEAFSNDDLWTNPSIVDEVEDLADEYDALKTENAKLRELVQDYDKVLASMNALCDCDFVPLCDGTLLALRSRMYDLGIEVE